MTAIQHKTIPQANPLQNLQNLMAQDMVRVNSLILSHMQSEVPLIPQLASYLIASGGKRIRPLLTLAATSLFSGDMVRAHRLAAAVEFIHTATLLHDDVVDDSDMRRGQKSANNLFGNEASVLVGDFLFSRAFQLMVADGNLDVLRILSDASAIIAEGEVLQLSVQNDLSTSLHDYYRVIEGKTASLFAAACEVGPVIAGSDIQKINAMRQFGTHLGMVFQISDDVLDYDSARAKLGKTIGDDFREGKMTAPVILALQQATADEKKFWHRTMAEKDQKETDLAMAQDILESHQALQKGLSLAQDFAIKAHADLALLPDSMIKQILGDLVDFVVTRRS